MVAAAMMTRSAVGTKVNGVCGAAAAPRLRPRQQQQRRSAREMACGASAKKGASLATTAAVAAASLVGASQAHAVEQVADLAAADNRASVLLLLLAPAVGWVGFNILNPALNQFKNMDEKNKSLRSAVGVLGALGLAMAASEPAQAAQEVAELAADNRFSVLILLFAPALGWVGFNILLPAINQLQNMQDKNDGKRR